MFKGFNLSPQRRESRFWLTSLGTTFPQRTWWLKRCGCVRNRVHGASATVYGPNKTMNREASKHNPAVKRFPFSIGLTLVLDGISPTPLHVTKHVYSALKLFLKQEARLWLLDSKPERDTATRTGSHFLEAHNGTSADIACISSHRTGGTGTESQTRGPG